MTPDAAAEKGTTMKLPFELQKGENVLITTRRHLMFLIPKLVGIFLLAVIPIALLTGIFAWRGWLDGTAALVVAVIDLVWAAWWGIRGYFTWYKYQNDIWIVTNQRIIDSIKNNWFHHHMASADLVDVQDIAVEKSGVVPTMFNYGDVRCQTAGEQPNFVLRGIPQPAKLLELVDASRDAARRDLSRVAWKP